MFLSTSVECNFLLYVHVVALKLVSSLTLQFHIGERKVLQLLGIILKELLLYF